MEELPHFYFSWIVSSPKQRHVCEMLPLETKQSGGTLLPQFGSPGERSVSRGNSQHQALQQEGLQRKEEGTAQLQDWNVECKNLESRRQIGKFEKRKCNRAVESSLWKRLWTCHKTDY